MRLLLRFMGFLFTAGTIVFLVGVTAVAGLLWHYSKELPDYSQLQDYEPAVMTRVQQGAKQAEAASALPPEKRFVALSDAMGFTDFFSARGVSVDQAHACLANPANAERVAKDAQSFSDQGVDSTPTLMINGIKTDATSWAELEPMLQKAGAR